MSDAKAIAEWAIAEFEAIDPEVHPEYRVDVCVAIKLARAYLELRAEVERLRGAWERIIDEISKTRGWRRATGMKTATDTSEFSSLPPSALKALERLARAALNPTTKD